jgi:ATP-dependent protease ClpP protease subunit
MKFNKFTWVAIFLFLALLSYGNASGTDRDGVITLSKNNTLVLGGVIDGNSVGEAISKAKKLDKGTYFGSSKPIYLFMNTPGGEIQSGIELMEAFRGLNRHINTVTLFAASMGFQVVQGLGERLVLQNGVLMSHRASGGFEGSFGGQSPSQVENRLNFWTRRLTEMDLQTVKRSKGKQTLESYQKAYANELWLTGGQAVDGGYADRIVAVKCDSSLDGFTTHTTEFLGIRIDYDLDNCPINTSPMNIRIVSPENSTVSKKESKSVEASMEREIEIKNKFVEQYMSRQRTVVPTY